MHWPRYKYEYVKLSDVKIQMMGKARYEYKAVKLSDAKIQIMQGPRYGFCWRAE